jgi:hypothetical protein
MVLFLVIVLVMVLCLVIVLPGSLIWPVGRARESHTPGNYILILSKMANLV